MVLPLHPARRVVPTLAVITLTAALVAAFAAFAGSAESGVIHGTVELGAAPTNRPPRGNAYPGHANSLPPGATNAGAGGVDETVVWFERLPAGMAVPPPAGPHPTLEQRRQQFVPRVIALQAGTSVDFPNRDPVYHNVFSVSPARRFDLGKYREGQSRSVRFDKPGVVRVFCDIHSDMAAFIVVIRHHLFARADASGRFTLPAVPGGDYTLKVWHPSRGESHQSVHVPDRGAADVTVRI